MCGTYQPCAPSMRKSRWKATRIICRASRAERGPMSACPGISIWAGRTWSSSASGGSPFADGGLSRRGGGHRQYVLGVKTLEAGFEDLQLPACRPHRLVHDDPLALLLVHHGFQHRQEVLRHGKGDLYPEEVLAHGRERSQGTGNAQGDGAQLEKGLSRLGTPRRGMGVSASRAPGGDRDPHLPLYQKNQRV